MQDGENRRFAVVVALVFAPGSEPAVPVDVAPVAGVPAFGLDFAARAVAALVSAVLAALASLLPSVSVALVPPVAPLRGLSHCEATQVYWENPKPLPNLASEK